MDVSFDECTDPEGTLALEPAVMQEEKHYFWFSRVFNCMSSVLSILGKQGWLDDSEDSFHIKPERIVDSVLLGEGAQGKVYLAMMKQRSGVDRKVAVKYVAKIDDVTARHLRRINHENIVQTIGVCMDPPKQFIIMEYCENGSLFDYMRSGVQFSPIQMVNFAKNIARGMAHLHQKKIIHRDLKSPNVLIAGNLVAKVSDFGTSRTTDGASAQMTFAGTVNWMAPEVIRAECYSEKIDIWSFGVVLWELVTLQVPYYRMEQHTIMWGVGTDSVSLPIPMGVPNSIHMLLVQCWNRKYAQRPNFGAIVQSLDLITEELQSYDVRAFMDRQAAWAREARDSLEKAYLAKKELMADFCRCGARRDIKIRQDSSTSSEALSKTGYRAHLKVKPAGSLCVDLVEDKAITKLADCECTDQINRNLACLESKKECVVEMNGNVSVKDNKKMKMKTAVDV